MSAEPIWWAEARRLSDGGMSLRLVARTLNVTEGAVTYALNAAYRERHKATAKKQRAARAALPRRPRDTAYNARHALMTRARRAAEITGEPLDFILILWGHPPRYARRQGMTPCIEGSKYLVENRAQ